MSQAAAEPIGPLRSRAVAKPKAKPKTKPKPALDAPAEPAVSTCDGRTLAVANAVAKIGQAVREMLDGRASKAEQAAADYWGASIANGLTEAWRNRAKRMAVAVGVLPDHAATPFAVGTLETVYAGSLVAISMKVVEQADRVDVPGLVAGLEKSGVKPAVLKRLLKKNTRSFPGAHIFTASLVN